MNAGKPSIVVTGASGIVGRHFLEAVKEDFTIYAVARRSMTEADITPHPNIKWIQVDIAHFDTFKAALFNALKPEPGVDFLLHMASYYDYNYDTHPEYERTNIRGTRHTLDLAKELGVKRFVFTSSVAACDFRRWETITEQTPLDADYPYAVSKRRGEEMVREYSSFFPCSIVRPGAVFTDWCEYGILYMNLTRWLSGKLDSRIMEGHGDAGVPYIHSHDLNHFLVTLFRKSKSLPVFDIYISAHDEATSHRSLFETATELFYGKKSKPFFIPKFLLLPAVAIRYVLGRLVGRPPFERPWMLNYVDKKLNVDSSYTRKKLGWQPTKRFHILRRMLYLIEKMKSHPDEWHFNNVKAMKRVSLRPNMVVYEIMVRRREEVVQEIRETLLDRSRRQEFLHYQKANRETLKWDIGVFYQLLTASVRNSDRLILTNYARDLLSPIRYTEGFDSKEVCRAILDTGKIVVSRLIKEPELKELSYVIHDYIILTLRLTVDEVENAFERLAHAFPEEPPDRSDIEQRLIQLETFCVTPEQEDN